MMNGFPAPGGSRPAMHLAASVWLHRRHAPPAEWRLANVSPGMPREAQLVPAPEYCSSLPTIEEADVKVVHCPCGKDVQGETDDQLVEAVEAHVASDHPEMAGKYSREQILGMAHEH
jgi:hypothetical protein